jgi:glycosyltransferase involved in cell wall biosynthesis
VKRIGIVVVAYNAASTLAQVLDRIPSDFRGRIDHVLIGDDASQDSTYLVSLGYQQLKSELPLTVVRHERNLGYGGNQKASYRWAIDHGVDIVVLLHGDGQYAPELLPDIVAPLENGVCDAVFGSRMLDRGGARRGGMPRYKYVGNRILTRVENALAGMELSEWHSGYRAYSANALRRISFESNSDGFDFDTQIILQLQAAGLRIAEVPIPTYYGDEISHVNGLAYARQVVGHAVRYRLHASGFGVGGTVLPEEDRYEFKPDQDSSHERILTWMRGRDPSSVLDLGCSDGVLAERLSSYGHKVTGVDVRELPGVRDRVERFVLCDLNAGLPPETGCGYDVVIAADVLEHVRHPDRILVDLRDRLSPGGTILVSVPNFGHWYPRARVVSGTFDYDQRGILDRDHVRFFTRKSIKALFARCGFVVRRHEALGLPIDVLDRGVANGRTGGRGRQVVRAVDGFGVSLRPTLFAYQYLFELETSAKTAAADGSFDSAS